MSNEEATDFIIDYCKNFRVSNKDLGIILKLNPKTISTYKSNKRLTQNDYEVLEKYIEQNKSLNQKLEETYNNTKEILNILKN